MNIKLYADGADKSEIARLSSTGKVDGFTTNPSLMRKAGVKNYLEHCTELADFVGDRPISFEVIADNLQDMRIQAELLSSLSESVYVKIPITNSVGISTLSLCKDLASSGTKLNVTALLTEKQFIDTLEVLRGGAPSVISVFAGRIADTGVDPVPMMKSFAKALEGVSEVELLWASPREILNLVQADQVGCDIITMTPDLWGKLNTLGKNLEEYSLETVQMFLADASASGFEL